jgi:hypothetical protein
MKSLFEYLNTNVKQTKVVPKNGEELMKVVYDEIKRLGFTCDLNHIDVSHVTNFNNVFYAMSPEMTFFNGDVSEWDVSRMKSCDFMFSSCHFDGDLSQWDVSHCESFRSMFNTATHFTGKGLENWRLKSAKTTSYMFHKTFKFSGDTITDWKIPKGLTEMSHMFTRAFGLEADFSKWNLSHVPLKGKSEIFDYCQKMRVEWLPKGLDPNNVKIELDKQAWNEVFKHYNQTEKESLS